MTIAAQQAVHGPSGESGEEFFALDALTRTHERTEESKGRFERLAHDEVTLAVQACLQVQARGMKLRGVPVIALGEDIYLTPAGLRQVSRFGNLRRIPATERHNLDYVGLTRRIGDLYHQYERNGEVAVEGRRRLAKRTKGWLALAGYGGTLIGAALATGLALGPMGGPFVGMFILGIGGLGGAVIGVPSVLDLKNEK